MPSVPFRRLIRSFIDTLERNGATVFWKEQTSPRRPAHLRVSTGSKTVDCMVYLWTITHGGRNRPRHEQRIQMTNVREIRLFPGMRTLLGGWSPEFEVYAFWDARRHTKFSRKSPSLQVNARVLERAGWPELGIASQHRPSKQGLEVVVACHPASLLWYVENGEALHDTEEHAASVAELVNATPEEEKGFLEEAQGENDLLRRHQVVQVVRAYRDAKFRPAVLQAYQYKCAVCRCDLKLVEAAHIVPVSHPKSTDEVTNGLALCRLHHGAFDNALLGVQSDCSVVVNPLMVRRLRDIRLASALDEFRRRLPRKIHLPFSLEARPDPENLRIGLESRGWPREYIK